jgi:tetratricopeptide (TPR) repeat protein
MKMKVSLPPYPMLGECYRELAVALGTKNSNRELDRWAREGDFDWSLEARLKNELIVEPLAQKVGMEFAAFVSEVCDWTCQRHLALISHIALDSMTRGEALSLLLEHHLLPGLTAFLINLRKGIDGPDLNTFIHPDQNPLDVVFCWLENCLDIESSTIAKHFYPTSLGNDKNGREALNRWRDGSKDQCPDLASICAIADLTAKKYPDCNVEIEHLKAWLLVARMIIKFEKKHPDLQARVFQNIVNGVPSRDIGYELSIANIQKSERRDALVKPGLMLGHRLRRTTPKRNNDRHEIAVALENFEQMLLQHDREGICDYYLNWMKGRYYLLSGEYIEALSFYEKAADGALYRSGGTQNEVLEEALALAAKLGKLPLYKRLKHRAIVFGVDVLPPISDKQIANQDEMKKWSDINFLRLFPLQGHFSSR